MDMAQIKALLDMMDAHGLCEMEVQDGEFAVRLCKPTAASAAVVAPVMAPVPAAAPAASGIPAGTEPIKSPIVGTFYASPSPDAGPFVAVGARVTPGTVVCIIEAMKVMNEIKCEVSGVIEKVLVQNGEPVEYGQPLFLLRPE